ncbi:MAG: hypothetical protein LBJ03_03435 [Holosporales bacterium]|nr:hypothetical protein [Holosporales bacterium]
MSKTWHFFVVIVLGLSSSIASVAFTILVQKLINISLYTFSIWIILPIGAVATGFAASYGCYIASVYFNKRINNFLLLQIIIIAISTQFILYWLGYYFYYLEDGRKLREVVTFSKYLDVLLTKSHYYCRVRGIIIKGGEIGNFGYYEAFSEFCGFLIGGCCVYLKVRTYPMCGKCQLFFGKSIKKDIVVL